MALTLNIGKSTNLGNYRENNEDSIEVKVFPDLTVAIVADGMGGQAAGEIASKRAVDIIPRELRKTVTAGVNADATKVMIRRAIVQANEEIMAMGQLDKEMKNMGTTVVMAVWRKAGELFIAGVGDSRAYLVRDKKIKQLTVDHSLAQALVEAKTISAAEAKEHRFRNVLWKYLGSKEVGEGPEVAVVPLAGRRPVPALHRRAARRGAGRQAACVHRGAGRRPGVRRRARATRPRVRLARQRLVHRDRRRLSQDHSCDRKAPGAPGVAHFAIRMDPLTPPPLRPVRRSRTR